MDKNQEVSNNTNNQIEFDNELSWCIQKLSQMMQKEKNEKKLRDYDKHVNNLKNPNVILIKKRQIMFNVFGDYRTKMKKEQAASKTSSAEKTIKFSEAKENPMPKSIVIRSKISSIKSNQLHSEKSKIEENKNPFKFDFKIPEQQ